MELKLCPVCAVSQPPSEFYVNRRGRGGLDARCKACRKQYASEWKSANRDKARASERRRAAEPRSKEQVRRYALQRRYGITVEEYEAQLEAQGGACALCRRSPRKIRLHVDHCHRTGKLRGLLCGPCNLFLGRLEDRPERLSEYVDAPGWGHVAGGADPNYR